MTTLTRASEAQEQATLFQFLETIQGRIPAVEHCFHVPNGGKRDKVVAAQMKRQGVKRGVPDILFPVGSREYVGLAIELKIEGGRVSPEQQDWIALLRRQHWLVVVAWGWQSAAREILIYLEQKPEDYGL